MIRFSNVMMGTLNFVTLVLSIPLIIVGIWLATRQDSECLRFLQQPTIAIGAIILIVSLVGFLGSCYRISWMLWIYLFGMLLLILLLLFFTVFALLVTNNGASHAVAGAGFREYRIHDYSSWLQHKVEEPENWRRIKSCLRDAYVCYDLALYADEQSFRNASLSPLESGCCKPPMSCGYRYENATLWSAVPSTSSSLMGEYTVARTEDADCSTWSNDQHQLCYDCSSCRAGLLANIKRDWHKVGVVNAVVLVFLVLAYGVGCCAFYNAKRDGHYNQRGLGRFCL